MNKKVKTIIFPVGGLGTRFLPATKATPKEMLPVAEKPLIQYAFEEARHAGIEKFIFVTGRNKNSIEDHFDNAFELQTILSGKKKDEMIEKTIGWLPPAGNIVFLRQQNPLGLGHAILCAEKFIGEEPFAISLADEMTYYLEGNYLKEMIQKSEEESSNVVGVMEVPAEETYKYGIVGSSEDVNKKDCFKINNMVEKPELGAAPSNFSLIGRYILQPEIFNFLRKTEIGAGNEFQLTDAMKQMLSISEFHGLKFKENRFDCGSIVGYLEANIFYALQNPVIKKNVEAILKKHSK